MKVIAFKKRVQAEFNALKLEDLPFQSEAKALQKELIEVKKSLFEETARLKSALGLSMDTSLFFRGSYFEARTCGNILGLSSKVVKDFI